MYKIKFLNGGTKEFLTLRCANLNKANLSKVCLNDEDLSGAILINANLSGAVLIDANLNNSDLRGADLRIARLIGADLSGANLSGANLSGAKLSSADLSGAKLDRAKLDGVSLYGTIGNGKEIVSSAYFGKYHVVYCVPTGCLQIGCENHSVGEWKEFTDEEINAMARDALEYHDNFLGNILKWVDGIKNDHSL